MTLGIYEALREHKRGGNSVVTWDWENDRAVLVPPETIALPAEYDVEVGSAEPRNGVADRDPDSSPAAPAAASLRGDER